jgi:hypothetical protein
MKRYLKKYESFQSSVWIENGPFKFDEENILSKKELDYIKNFVSVEIWKNDLHRDDGVYYMKYNDRYLCTDSIKLLPNIVIYRTFIYQSTWYQPRRSDFISIEDLSLYTPSEVFVKIINSIGEINRLLPALMETVGLLNSREVYISLLKHPDILNLSYIEILDEGIILEAIRIDLWHYTPQIPKDMFTENVCVEIFNNFTPPINWKLKAYELLHLIPYESLTKKSLTILARKCPNSLFYVDIKSESFNDVMIETLKSVEVAPYWKFNPSKLKIDEIQIWFNWVNNLSDLEKSYISDEILELIEDKFL